MSPTGGGETHQAGAAILEHTGHFLLGPAKGSLVADVKDVEFGPKLHKKCPIVRGNGDVADQPAVFQRPRGIRERAGTRWFHMPSNRTSA